MSGEGIVYESQGNLLTEAIVYESQGNLKAI